MGERQRGRRSCRVQCARCSCAALGCVRREGAAILCIGRWTGLDRQQNRASHGFGEVSSDECRAIRSGGAEDKIAKLEDNLQTCQMENSYLRTNATAEVLATMPNFAQRGLPGPQHLNSLPAPEPAAHPALQPPQH